jgi:hypothetical protein
MGCRTLMKDSQRVKLRFGNYKTPKFEYDDIVFDDAHGGRSSTPTPSMV